jgi:hypothetical protein
MRLCNIFVEGNFPEHLEPVKNYLHFIAESEIPALDYFLYYKDSRLSLHLKETDSSLILCLDFDQELKKLDIQGLSLKGDPLKRLLRTKQKDSSQTPLIEIGTGAGKDSMHFLALGLEVLSFERHPIIFALCLDAKKRGRDPRLQNLALLFGEFASTQINNSWVYFDPMFEHDKNRSAKSPKTMQVFQSLIKESDGHEIFVKLINLKPYRLIVKRSKKQKSFAKASFTLEGKSICYDVYIP